MKANVTVKLEADLLREARILAAEQGSSISAILAAQLERVVRERRGFEQARISAKGRLQAGYDLGWTPPASRDEIYER